MNWSCGLNTERRGALEAYLPESFDLWGRIEDLGTICGYDAALQFDLLRRLPDAYPRMTGRDPDEIAEEHPMQALAMLVRRFLAEYPEEAALLTAAVKPAVPAVRLKKAA